MAYLGNSPFLGIIGAPNIQDLAVTPAKLSTGAPLWDAAGNVGIGATPSAWGSTFKAQQVGIGSVFGTTSSNNASFGSNLYVDSASAVRYLVTAPATRYLQLSGTHRWYNAPSGTAGDVATLTQTAMLDTAGNFILGSTSSSAARLTSSFNATLPSSGPVADASTLTTLWLVSDNAKNNILTMDAFGVTNSIIGRRTGGTVSAPTATPANLRMLTIGARGYGATGYAAGTSAFIEFSSAENFTDTARGAYIGFYTTAAGTTSVAERIRITDAGVVSLNLGQLKFPATQVASSDANTLDDYEEGTWTPATNTSGITINAIQNANYIKIGRFVQVYAYFTITSSGTTGANWLGLPFPSTAYGPATRYYANGFPTFSGVCYVENAATFIIDGGSLPAGTYGVMVSATYMSTN